MAFLMPAALQKRLVRYVLSQLSFLDMASFDLDRLEGAWGRRTTGEIKDIPFRIDKLTELLNLPSWVKIKRADVHSLRLTVPLNIWSESIEVVIDGIDIRCSVIQERRTKEKESQRASKTNQTRDSRQINHDPGGETNSGLPSIEEMAQSFVAHQSEDEKERLKSELAQQTNLEDSQASLGGEEEEGLGQQLSLPAVMADFLWGIGERLKVSLKNISFAVEFPVDVPAEISSLGGQESVSFKLTVDGVELHGVQAVAGKPPDTQPSADMGSHRLVVSTIQGFIVSEPAVFAAFSAMSVPPSPTETHATNSRDGSSSDSSNSVPGLDEPNESSASNHLNTLHASQDLAMSSSTILDAPADMFRSMYRTSFPDTAHENDDAYMQSSMIESQYHGFGSEGGISQFDEYSSPDQSFLEHGRIESPADSVAALQESETLPNPMQDLGKQSVHGSSYSASGSTASENSSHTLPPSQLLRLASEHARSSDQEHRVDDSNLGHTVFHEFSGPESPSKSMHESHIFHDTTSRRNSSSSNQMLDSISTDDPPADLVEASQDEEASEAEPQNEDLTQSILFSDDQARSIYMSAIKGDDEADESALHVPGGWGMSSMISETQTSGNVQATDVPRHHRNDSDATIHGAPRSYAPSVEQVQTSATDAPLKSTTQSKLVSDDVPHDVLSKRLLRIEAISVEIPISLFRKGPSDAEHDKPVAAAHQRRSATRMPGEMSLYDETLTHLERSTMRASFTATRQESFGSDVNESGSILEINVRDVHLENDMGLTKLLVVVAQQLLTANSSSDPQEDHGSGEHRPPPPWSLRIDGISWAFVDSMQEYLESSKHSGMQSDQISRNVLLVSRIMDLEVVHKPQESGQYFGISIGRYTFGYHDELILHFESLSSSSEKLPKQSKDISVKIQLPLAGFSEIKVSTAQLRITLDLRRLDETFGWFGGLSGMIGLSNSVISTTTIVEQKKPIRQAKVRFDTPKNTLVTEDRNINNTSTTKVTAVINGILVDLFGQTSSVYLKTTPMKLVHRSEGIGMQIDQIRFEGPFVYDITKEPAVQVTLGPFKLSYLQTPGEQDLSRLLGLLSPSTQRQEEVDDDVLVDTLLRQRRKGGVLRVNVESITGNIDKLGELEYITMLSKELQKLATVTKYLPEDDRPGVMVLALLQKVHLDVDVNPQLGKVFVEANNVDAVCVTMPFLLLLGVDRIKAGRGQEQLIGQVVPQKIRQVRGNVLEHTTFVPMVTMKFIGNDLEPTVKIRLCNLCVEYYVTTLMDIMGITETASGEVIIAEMVHSVASLADTTNSSTSPPRASAAPSKSQTAKPMRLDLKFRECALGLNPRRSSAKGLLLFTDTKFEAILPVDDSSPLETTIHLKKVSFLAIDDTRSLRELQEPSTQGLATAVKHNSQEAVLTRAGYVATTDLSEAKIALQMSAKDAKGERTVDVEILDKLLVLDSCADSTQTMISIFTGLSPPMPPSNELKYRTEVMPVEDMLNSIVGELVVPENEPESGDPSPQTASYDFAKQLGYAVPDLPGSEDSTDEDFQQVPSKRSALNFDDEYFFSRTESTAWKGTALEFNSNSNKYFRAPRSKVARSPLRVIAKDVNIIWNLFDGYDWQHTRSVIGEAVADVEKRAAARKAHRRHSTDADYQEEESVIGDFLFNSVYIGVGAKDDPRDLARQVNRHLADDDLETASYATPTTVISTTTSGRGHLAKTRRKHLRLERSKHQKITIDLKGVSADIVIFPPGSGETQTSLILRVHDLEIFDHIRTSTWKKFATYMHDYGPRDVSTPMILIDLLNVKPVSDLPASELVLRVNVLPLRLHVDQDAIDFLTRFFEFKDTGREGQSSQSSPGEEPFIQRFEIFAVPVKLDFKPKRVDYGGLRSGKTTEFMNFIILDGSDMVLDHIIMYGISGFERMGKMLNDIWMPAIKQNQLPGVLAGLAPVRGIVNVGSGVKDLVMVPWQEYRKDGRLIRAMQKGAFAFAKNTTTELTRLGAKVALGTQTVLQNAEDLLIGHASEHDGGPPANPRSTPGADEDVPQQISPYADQPLGVMAGLRGAYRHLERDMLYARDAVIAMPGEVRDSGSATGAARAVLRGAPTVILRPAMGVTRAIGTAFMGATNALDKDERRRAADVRSFRVLFSRIGQMLTYLQKYKVH